jgi:hypothetical protein
MAEGRGDDRQRSNKRRRCDQGVRYPGVAMFVPYCDNDRKLLELGIQKPGHSGWYLCAERSVLALIKRDSVSRANSAQKVIT